MQQEYEGRSRLSIQDEIGFVAAMQQSGTGPFQLRMLASEEAVRSTMLTQQ